ncbi:Methyltransferase domain-containing protein [Cohaesibacter sp. ES.047]|uniref:class I SAM-dependent methyltransferase n=1 Tax=Cohaesibacter sp. ES.047 TaxID=1798205 RepID=UPI000BB97C25|nr:class I SAM-dependent methyltransferase [Cohaesibacter sp. ES.047]SNY94299.1 Methyltransferase domain-containing protein [Cohaesibacter sp. ES.047]
MTESCATCRPERSKARLMPFGVHVVCGLPVVTRQRQKIVPMAFGDVVEIGFGSGLNLPHYDSSNVRHVIGVNPDDGLPQLGRRAIDRHEVSAELLVESAEAMSLPSQNADSVVVTYSLCSIPDVEAALGEARRILKPHGRLFFCEHGRSPSAHVAKWQDRLTPPWRAVAAGCHLNRDTGALLRDAGFALEQHDVFDLGLGTRILGTHHMGVATVR